jgi:hypothetical protein
MLGILAGMAQAVAGAAKGIDEAAAIGGAGGILRMMTNTVAGIGEHLGNAFVRDSEVAGAAVASPREGGIMGRITSYLGRDEGRAPVAAAGPIEGSVAWRKQQEMATMTPTAPTPYDAHDIQVPTFNGIGAEVALAATAAVQGGR